MGRKRVMAKPAAMKELTIAKTNGFTIVDSKLVLTLQLVQITQAQGKYITYWTGKTIKDLENLKRKDLVDWDKRGPGYSPTTKAFAGLRLTSKGLKVLTTAGGTFFGPMKRSE